MNRRFPDSMRISCRAKNNMKKIIDAIEDLKARKSDILTEIEIGKREHKQHTDVVARWLQKAENVEDEVANMKSEYEQVCCRLFGDCSLNCKLNYSIGRRAAELYDKVIELKTEGSFDVVMKPVLPKGVKEIPTTSMVVGVGIQSNLEKVWGFLNDDLVGIVGIWGMGGVGKTTLLKAINNDFLQCRVLSNASDPMLFDHVIWVVASRECNSVKLQRDIAKYLEMPPHSDAQDIFNFLKMKNFLLLLDDLWDFVDLGAIGIPNPHLSNITNNIYKQKVVFTTRSEQVCASMNAQKRIKVGCLDQEESWKLFVENVNISEEIIGADPCICNRAKEVAKKCGGLPLALIVIGRAMSTKRSSQEWDYATTSLEKSQGSNIIPGIEGSIFPSLKFSYDSLQGNIIRDCFLFCSLWPEDFEIAKNDLIMSWMGLGLIDAFDDISEAYNYGHFIIGVLLEACLLDPSTIIGNVKMHDVIRDLALWIASNCGQKRNRWVVRAGVGMTEVSSELAGRWGGAELISLMHNELQMLPELAPYCPNVTTLHFQHNKFMMIPHEFFQCMPALRFLDLSDCDIQELPSEIGCLVELQYLNLSNTKLSLLPNELGRLLNLKYLLLKNTLVHALPSGVLSRLSKLLVLDLCPSGKVTFEDLKYLEGGVKALGVKATSVAALQRFSCVPISYLNIDRLKDSTLTEFQLLKISARLSLQELRIQSCPNLENLVVDAGHGIMGKLEDRCLPRLEKLELWYLMKLKGIIWRGVVPTECFQRLQHLSILRCHRLKNVTWVLKLPQLVRLILQECNAMEQVISDDNDEGGNGIEIDRGIIFPRLQKILLNSLPRLGSICGHTLDFPSLEHVAVLDCPRLKKLPFEGQIANKKLRRIFGNKEWWDSIEWEGESIKPILQRFFRKAPHLRSRGSWGVLCSWFQDLPIFQQQRLHQMGFGEFLSMGCIPIFPGLIRPFAKRARISTGTIVTRVGEFVLGLEDVARITGLPIHGLPVTGHVNIDYRPFVETFFGEVPEQQDPLQVLSVGWIMQRTRPGHEVPGSTIVNAPTEFAHEPGEEADRQLRGFLMCFLGGLLFPTDFSWVSCMYLPFLEDLGAVGSYAWGAAALAHLSHQLEGIAWGTVYLGGFAAFLQLWIYEHFVMFRPISCLAYAHSFPRGLRWMKANWESDAPWRHRCLDRSFFESLDDSQVIWRPYTDGEHADKPVIRDGQHLFDKDIWLHAMFYTAPHMISRAARQLGRSQRIPHWTPQLTLASGAGLVQVQNFCKVYREPAGDWISGGRPCPSKPTTVEEDRAYWDWFFRVFKSFIQFHQRPLFERAGFSIREAPLPFIVVQKVRVALAFECRRVVDLECAQVEAQLASVTALSHLSHREAELAKAQMALVWWRSRAISAEASSSTGPSSAAAEWNQVLNRLEETVAGLTSELSCFVSPVAKVVSELEELEELEQQVFTAQLRVTTLEHQLLEVTQVAHQQIETSRSQTESVEP